MDYVAIPVTMPSLSDAHVTAMAETLGRASGTVLAYWVQADDDDALKALPLGPTTRPGNLTRAEVVARYQERRGREVEDLLFSFVLGAYRIAIIAQQIWFRYARGYTTDPRFSSLGFAVAVVAGHAARMIDEGRVR